MIQVTDLSLRVGKFELHDISFEIPQGQYGVLMGRTGCGKTSILEALCGLKKVLLGQVILLGRNVTNLQPAERGIGYVPQDGALFSTYTIREHLAFALEIRHWSRKDINQRVQELAELLHLEALLDRKPFGLSGGEVQRVSLGRALAARPGILCLDEPLSALDEETREQMYQLLRDVQRRTGVTSLHITHSQSEANALADKCLVLADGKVRDAGKGGAPGTPSVSTQVRAEAPISGTATGPATLERSS